MPVSLHPNRHCALSSPCPCPLWPQQADSDGVKVDSKRYLNRITDLFARKYDNPSTAVFKECQGIAAKLGGDSALVFKIGPAKKKGRVIEKALMQENRFDLIRDIVRAMFIVSNLVSHVTCLHNGGLDSVCSCFAARTKAHMGRAIVW